MTTDIKQIEEQISILQRKLDILKKPKLEVTRQFTGEYFNVYEGKQYRRMESEGIPIWEYFWSLKNDWVLLEQEEAKTLEEVYQQYCA